MQGPCPPILPRQAGRVKEKFDELEHCQVFRRPEDVGVTVEYLNPSFLVKKTSGGFRLVSTVPLTRNLPPLVSRETRRVSRETRRVLRETRITELWGVEYITREKPVYMSKLMTPPVSKSAIDSRYLSTRDKPGYICSNQDFVAEFTRPPALKSAIDSTEIFIDSR